MLRSVLKVMIKVAKAVKAVKVVKAEAHRVKLQNLLAVIFIAAKQRAKQL